MTKIIHECQRDGELVQKTFNVLLRIVFGKDYRRNLDVIEFFSKKVETIRTFSQEAITARLGKGIYGKCFHDHEKNVLNIELVGYKNLQNLEEIFVRHEAFHELAHALVEILPQLYYPEERKGVLYTNEAGMVAMRDAVSKQYVLQHYYGKIFNEVFMDIFAHIGLAMSKTVNFQENVDKLILFPCKVKGAETDFIYFAPVVHLLIAAFANDTVCYSDLIKEGKGIVLEKV